jgi:hypothetical protein
MTIHLTPEQERRVQAVISLGAYEFIEQVVDSALAAVEQRVVPGFSGTQAELDTLLAEGLASKELPVLWSASMASVCVFTERQNSSSGAGIMGASVWGRYEINATSRGPSVSRSEAVPAGCGAVNLARIAFLA